MRRPLICFTLLILSTCAGANSLEDCSAADSDCIKKAIVYIRSNAVASENRRIKIFRSLRSNVSRVEQAALDRDQDNWSREMREECMDPDKLIKLDDAIAGWTCLVYARDQRATGLDRKLAMVLEKKAAVYWPTGVSIHLSNGFLDIDYGSGSYTIARGEFDLSDKTSGKYNLSFSTPGSNGHQCAGETEMRRTGNSIFIIPKEASSPNVSQKAEKKRNRVQEDTDKSEKCNLTAEVFPFHVEMHGNYSCNELFACGARTATSGIFFR